MISHGILKCFPLNLRKFVPFFANIKKFSFSLESVFRQNVANGEFEQKDGQRQSKNGHGKVMYICFVVLNMEMYCGKYSRPASLMYI